MLHSLSESESWKQWDLFLQTAPETGFMQSSWWADFRLGAGYEHFAVVLKSKGEILGGAVVMKYSFADETCFYYIPEGPVIPNDEDAAREVFNEILTQLEKRRLTDSKIVSHLRIEPRWLRIPDFVTGFHAPLSNDRFTEPRNTICIDLSMSEEKLLAQMKPKGRYNIRLAQKHGVTVVEDPSESGIMDFIRLYKRTTSRHGIDSKPPGYFRELMAVLASRECGSIFFAECQGRRLAGAVVVYFGNRATYFFGGSLVQHRNVMAPYLLHFEIMRRSQAKGFTKYDLWGVSPANDRNHPWNTISIFKRKFGGEELNFVPTLDYVYDEERYREYASLGKNASRAETFVPAPLNEIPVKDAV